MGLSHVARTSLVIVGVMALGSTGCLITERPDFDRPLQTPPFMVNLSPTTSVAHTIPFQPGTPKASKLYQPTTIGFDVMSEDLGQKVYGLFLLDFKGLGSNDPLLVLDDKTLIDPGTMGQEQDNSGAPARARSVERQIQLGSSVDPTCHTITVVLSHSFAPASARPLRVGDVALNTWFYYVGADESAPEDFVDCAPEPRKVDAGTDAPADGGGL